MSIKVRGDDELAAALSRIGDGLGHLDDAARAAGEVLAVDARGRAPKRTGTLAASIRASGPVVGTPIRYGAPVHNGVPSRNQRPQPFLTDAVRAQSTELGTIYAADIQRLIDRSM